MTKPTKDMSIGDAIGVIESFIGSNLRKRIGDFEHAIKNCDGDSCRSMGIEAGITSDLLGAAYTVKKAAGQINVLIHAAAIVMLIPQIIEKDERIEYVSLGAGNAGRSFDLETNLRVAEFKFIHWQGGAESIRQNGIFKDFYMLAEDATQKRKELYVLGLDHPLRFLRGNRAIKSVLSKNNKLFKEFQDRYGDRFSTVSQYYNFRQNDVAVRDATPLVPELLKIIS